MSFIDDQSHSESSNTWTTVSDRTNAFVVWALEMLTRATISTWEIAWYTWVKSLHSIGSYQRTRRVGRARNIIAEYCSRALSVSVSSKLACGSSSSACQVQYWGNCGSTVKQVPLSARNPVGLVLQPELKFHARAQPRVAIQDITAASISALSTVIYRSSPGRRRSPNCLESMTTYVSRNLIWC
jgi:hypothetical protein